MSGFLLDTNVLSEVVKRRRDRGVIRRLRAVAATELFTSSICAMELRFGAVRSADAELWDRLVDRVLDRVVILPVGLREAVRAGEILAALADEGQSIGTEDALIAATAACHDLIVVTRNVKHLGRVREIRVESWWPPR